MDQNTHTFISKNQDDFSLRLPSPTTNESFFIFSLVKAGSTLINGLVRDICCYNNKAVLSIFDLAFEQGIATNDIQSDIDKIIFSEGYIYGGFRHFFNFTPTIDLNPLKKILLVRDPRDILTSLYFSVKHSHMVPKSGRSRDMMLKRQEAAHQLEINDFVLKNAQSILNSYQSYLDQLSMDHWYIYKYEDIIRKKADWINQLTQLMELSLSDRQRSKLLSKYDIFPENERIHEHIRQVHAGNYKKHLNTETIERLNDKFSAVMNRFDYT